ncbi:hypothetical protein BIV57_21010 [Mangrovactinospora gilvigrisea]|uniref:HTH tetR-type domain-containing protein n=1 Tax=Mangrovactinospora gilvigrisea TaxID=1428644 RepID=A0A1J7BQ17_9ACTN|nr:TetR/AcrR family transcriptional regulator [Mangrovactinospora gilvigrisea]OIV35545.1 hypothetical protein BIV57_21010 [Mangrovactinospora gilvigrisea]
MATARRGDRRGEIVRAAFDMIGERGYPNTTLAAVAERVGLTQQGLLHYFPTKEDLLVAVLRRRDELDVSGGAVAGPAGVLEALAMLVDVNASRPGIVQTFTVLAGESVTDGHPARAYFAERYARVRALLAESLGDEVTAQLVIAALDGLQIQWLLDPEGADMRPAFDRLAELVGRGRAAE